MGGKQFGFGDHEQSTAKKRTRRERFLAEMEALVPWSALIVLIEPSYPKTSSKGGLGFPRFFGQSLRPSSRTSYGLFEPVLRTRWG